LSPAGEAAGKAVRPRPEATCPRYPKKHLYHKEWFTNG
jgi:hypothetical protein